MKIKLQYLKGSKEMALELGTNVDCRLWNVLEPKLPDYQYEGMALIPTFGIEGLKKHGLLNKETI